MLSSFHRLKKERLPFAPELSIGGEWGFKIGEQPSRNRNGVPLRRQPKELFSTRLIHSGVEITHRGGRRNSKDANLVQS
jgi:hypothetical protein